MAKRDSSRGESRGKGGRKPDPERARKVGAVCTRVAKGALVKDACAAEGVLAATFYEWVLLDVFADLYARAREAQGHAFAEQAVSIAHGGDQLTQLMHQAVDEHVKELDPKVRRRVVNTLQFAIIQRDRLRVDTLKWAAARRAPAAWGDKQQVDHGGQVTFDVKVRRETQRGGRHRDDEG